HETTKLYTLSLHDALPIYAAPKIDSPPATTSAPEKPAAQAGPLFPTPPMPPVTPSDWTSRRAHSSAANSPPPAAAPQQVADCLRSEEHTSELQSRGQLVCR